MTCQAGTFNDAIAHDVTKCKDCGEACGPAEYKEMECTARKDIKCSKCSMCGKNEYTAAECSETADTVCVPVTDCQERCTFNEEAGQCWPTLHAIPCSTFNGDAGNCAATAHCKVNGKSCNDIINNNAAEDGNSGRGRGIVCIAAGRGDCQATQSVDGNGCTWDPSSEVCRPKQCGDIYDPTVCAASGLGCRFDKSLFYCNAKDAPVPCSRYYTSAMCAKASEYCSYSAEVQACIAAVPAASFVATAPCASFHGAALGSCPLDRCKRDVFANVCHGFHETVPCHLYPQREVCPGDASAIVREFRNVARTRQSDAQCALQRPQCDRDTEYEIKPGTLTSDILCGKLTKCSAAQYQTKAATTWSDRTCTVLTVCKKGAEFEAVAPTKAVQGGEFYTSDRTCAPVSEPCTEGKQYESKPITETSDRECNEYSSACKVPYQFEASPRTATSDRVCTFITPCKFRTEYQTAPSTATTDRQCKAATPPCDSAAAAADDESEAGEGEGVREGGDDDNSADASGEGEAADDDTAVDFFESTALTATSDRICQAVQVCNANTEFESLAPTPTTDRTCSAVRKPCAANVEFEAAGRTDTADRICLQITTCNATAYEVAAPTSTSNRQCASLACPGSMFRPQKADNSNSTTNNSSVPNHNGTTGGVWPCRHVRDPCTLGEEYENHAATSTSDRACSPTTKCAVADDLYQSVAATATTDAQCLPLQVCTAGEFYENVGPTATNDRGCAACTTCAAGLRAATQCNSTADTECVACNSCPPRTELVSNCTDARPKPICDLCDVCPIGFHWHPGLQGECTCARCSSCAPDEFETATCTDTHDRSCQLIRDECSTDEVYESAEPTATSDRTCTEASTCNATLGEYEKSQLSLRADRVCAQVMNCSKIACNPFNSTDVMYQVKGATYDMDAVCMCPTVCPRGTFEAEPPSLYSDRVCTPCTHGLFQNETAQAECNPWAECTRDEWECGAPGSRVDRKCCPVTRCNATLQYQLSPPTNTTDRRCGDQTVCDIEGQWEQVDATATSDRACSSIEECVPDVQYEVSPPSPSANRVCATIQSCFRGGAANSEWECGNYTDVANRECCLVQQCDGDSQFEESVPTPTSDRVCTNFTACNSTSEYISKRGVADADRECSPISDCAAQRPAAYQARPSTTYTDAVCIPVTICSVGMYQAQAAKAGMDAVCRDCNGVTQFQDTKGQTSCKPVRACKAGSEFMSSPPTRSRNGVCKKYSKCGKDEFESVAATATSDRECAQCRTCNPATDFEYQACTLLSESQDTVCRAFTETCDGTQYFEAVPPLPTADRVCQRHRSCSIGEWMAGDGNATHDVDCRLLSTCRPGSKQTARPSRTSDRICSRCTQGVDFTVGINERFCTPCSLQCPPGFGRTADCKTTVDISCKVCTQGLFSLNEVCTAWKVCQSGYFEVTAPSEVSDRACTPCPHGTWRISASEVESGSTVGCQRWSACPDGTQSAGTESRTADRTCVQTTTSTTVAKLTTQRTSMPAASGGKPIATTANPADLEASNTMVSSGMEEVVVYAVIGVIGLLFIIILAMTISGNGCGKRPTPTKQPHGGEAAYHVESGQHRGKHEPLEESEPVQQITQVLAAPVSSTGSGVGVGGGSSGAHTPHLHVGVVDADVSNGNGLIAKKQKNVGGKEGITNKKKKKGHAGARATPLQATAWAGGSAEGGSLWALEHGVETSEL